jgi:tetratricopeptide (TPR) repeat protein
METEEIGGLLDEVQKRRQTAIDQSWRAMVRGAADQPLVYRLVRLLLSERRVEDARDVVAWIKHTRFPNPFDARLEAEIDLEDGRQEEALGRAQELAARYRDQRALGQWYADFLTRAGQVERAIEQYRILCHQFPDDWQPWAQWIKLLSRDPPHSPSLESVLAEIGGKTPHFSRGMCWLAIDDRKNAVSELKEAARVEALTACQWRTLLDVLRSDGQPVAEAMLAKARAANPDAFWLPKP